MTYDDATLPRVQVARPANARPARGSISVIMISCEDGAVIEPCLQSVRGWVDEIVLVDMHSHDETRDLARRYGAMILDHERLSYADPARNFALAQARCEWTLMLDPDERIPPKLAQEIRRIVAEDRVDVVHLPFQQIMFGVVTQSVGAADGTHPRLFRTGTVNWPPEVHGHPDLTGLREMTVVSRGAELAVLHDTWRSVPQVVEKLMRYSPKDARNLQSEGVRFSMGRMVNVGIEEFMRRFFFGRAYEDGLVGFLTAFYFMFYRVTNYAQLWELEGRSDRFDQGVRRWGKRWAPAGRMVARIHRRLSRKQLPPTA